MARTLREVIAAVPAERRAKIAAAHRQKLIAEQKKRPLTFRCTSNALIVLSTRSSATCSTTSGTSSPNRF